MCVCGWVGVWVWVWGCGVGVWGVGWGGGWGITTNEIIGGMFLVCQNTTMWVYGAWINNITFNVEKHIAPLAGLLYPQGTMGITGRYNSSQSVISMA